MGGKSHNRGKRGGKGRGPRATGGTSSAPPPPAPSGDALLLHLTGAPASLEAAASGTAFPASVVTDSSTTDAGALRLRLTSWAALEPALAWLRDATDADRELTLEFAPALAKEHRAAVHAAAEAVGLGALASISSGVGGDRRIAVARVSSAAMRAARAVGAGAAADPAAAAKAALLYEWARRQGAVVSRDEALEIFTAKCPESAMPEALEAVWAARWPAQAAAAALAAAAAGGDAAALAAAIASAPDVVRSGAWDELTGAAPLHAAAAAGNVAAVEALLAAGAPADGVDADGKTALAVACRFEQCEVEGALLRAGAADPGAPAAAADVAAWAGAQAFPAGSGAPDSTTSVCGTEIVGGRLAELGSVAGADFSDADYTGSPSLPGSPLTSMGNEDGVVTEELPGTPDNAGGGRLRRRLVGLAPPLPAAVVARVGDAVTYGRAALGSGLAALEGSRAAAFKAGAHVGQRAVEGGRAALGSGLAALEGSKAYTVDAGQKVLEGGKAAVEGGREAVAAAAVRGRAALSAAEGLAAAGRSAAADAARATDVRAREAAAWARAHAPALAAGAGAVAAAAAVGLLLRERVHNARHMRRYTPRIN